MTKFETPREQKPDSNPLPLQNCIPATNLLFELDPGASESALSARMSELVIDPNCDFTTMQIQFLWLVQLIHNPNPHLRRLVVDFNSNYPINNFKTKEAAEEAFRNFCGDKEKYRVRGEYSHLLNEKIIKHYKNKDGENIMEKILSIQEFLHTNFKPNILANWDGTSPVLAGTNTGVSESQFYLFFIKLYTQNKEYFNKLSDEEFKEFIFST